jgi:4-amino-4-deoxy-L-arabinose transferase-like glycosyltransferase
MSTAATPSRRTRPKAVGLGLKAGVRAHQRAIEISALTLVAALAGFLFLSRESLWLDEAYSVTLAGSGWGAIWQQLSFSEANGSPYYILLHFWLGLGKSEFAVRSLSVLAAVAAIPVFYATATRLFNRSAARIGSLLLVTNAFFVYYQQEARSYALALFLVILATYAWIRWMEEPSTFWTVTYAVTASLSVYAHLFSLYVIAAHATAFVFRRRAAPSLPRLAGVYALMAILLVPLMLYFATGYTGQLWWVRAPTLHDLNRAFLELSGGANSPAHPHSGRRILLLGYAVAWCLALVVAGREWWAKRDRAGSWRYVLVIGWLLFPTFGSFLVSLFWKPMFIDRYLIVALPALALLAGVGFASIRARTIRFGAVGALVALSIVQLGIQYHDQTKEDWRTAAAYVSAHAKAGDAVVVFAPYTRMPFEYYLERSPGLAARVTPLFPASPWGRFNLEVDQARRPDLAQLARAQDQYRRIWLVFSQNQLNENDRRTTEQLSRILGRGRTPTTQAFRGPISVTLERPA